MRVDFNDACPEGVRWSVVTSAYRKIAEGVERGDALLWNLRDFKGAQVGSGLYFLVVMPGDGPKRIIPLMVLP